MDNDTEHEDDPEYYEPWYTDRKGLRDRRSWVLYVQADPDEPDGEARILQARIVACVNACMGVPTRQLTPGLVARLLTPAADT